LQKKREAEEALVLYKIEVVQKEEALRQKQQVELEKHMEERLAARHLRDNAGRMANDFRYKEALEMVETAIERDPDFDAAYDQKVHLLFWLKAYGEAKATINQNVKNQSMKKSWNKLLDLINVQDGEPLPLEVLLSGCDMGLMARFACIRYSIYNRDAYPFQTRYTLCRKALSYQNPNWPVEGLRVREYKNQVHVDLSGHKAFRVALGLQIFSVTHLDVSDTSLWYLADLLHLPLVELDISGSGIVRLDELVRIKTLKRLTVDKSAKVPAALHERGIEIIYR
jgi:hypothetical protein